MQCQRPMSWQGAFSPIAEKYLGVGRRHRVWHGRCRANALQRCAYGGTTGQVARQSVGCGNPRRSVPHSFCCLHARSTGRCCIRLSAAPSVSLPLACLSLQCCCCWRLRSAMATLAATNLWLGWVLPALFGTCGALALLLLEMARVRLERSRVFTNLSSYLPDSIARDIAFSLPSSSVEARRVNVTLLNADLRNFSRFGEARPPKKPPPCCTIFLLVPLRSSGPWRAAGIQ